MTSLQLEPVIEYPDSDGQPMSDNTLQFEWISILKWNLEAVFRDDPQVFIAGDLLWYPVEGSNRLRTAPDVMVVFGRPKGHRGSYMQWRENGIPPQVVFEVLSPGNRSGELLNKQIFYERYGVEEYYIYDPDVLDLSGMLRSGTELVQIPRMQGWISPRLGIQFQCGAEGLTILTPSGEPFRTPTEFVAQRDYERQRADRLAAQLRALGIDPAL